MSDRASVSRVFRLVAVPFRRAWHWFRYLPRGVQVGLALALVVGAAAGGYYATVKLQKRATHKETMAGWGDFEAAARKTDLPGMRDALDRVLAAHPNDPLATRRKAALESGAADPDDPAVAGVLVNLHVRENRLPEAAREAEKVLAKAPKDWRALCVLAHHALQVEQNPGKAREWLERLPDPADSQAGLDPGGLLYALQLHQIVDRDPGPLRTLIVRRVLPAFRGGVALAAPPAAKAQLLECYLAPFADPKDHMTELAGHWAAAARLADLAVAEAVEAGDVPVLVRLGGLGPRMLAALALVREHERMPPDQAAALDKEVTDRTRRAWEVVREKAPARPESYHGLAVLAARAGDFAAARDVLFQGLAACGDHNELLDLLVPIVRLTGDPVGAAKITWNVAVKAEKDPVKWCLAAHAMRAAGRRDYALAACARARELAPNFSVACRTEALLRLEVGEPENALYVLLPLTLRGVQFDPSAARLYARALVEVGRFKEADEWMEEQAKAGAPPAAAVAFLRGVLDAGPDYTRAGWVADRADRLLARRADDPVARRVMADALATRSELASPPWDPATARLAIRAYDALPAEHRGDLAVVAAVAGLWLKAVKDPGVALRAAAPLRDPANAPLLGPAQLEVLAAVLTADGDPDGAIRVLARVCVPPPLGGTIPGGTAGCWVQLALAYHAARRPAEAALALDRALQVPTRSSREQAEWAAAKLLLQRENP